MYVSCLYIYIHRFGYTNVYIYIYMYTYVYTHMYTLIMILVYRRMILVLVGPTVTRLSASRQRARSQVVRKVLKQINFALSFGSRKLYGRP